MWLNLAAHGTEAGKEMNFLFYQSENHLFQGDVLLSHCSVATKRHQNHDNSYKRKDLIEVILIVSEA